MEIYVLLALLVIVIVFAHYYEHYRVSVSIKKASSEIENYCKKNNLEFNERLRDKTDLYDFVTHSLLLDKGESREYLSEMSGIRNGVSFSTFYFKYITIDSEGGKYTNFETVCIISKPEFDFPIFRLKESDQETKGFLGDLFFSAICLNIFEVLAVVLNKVFKSKTVNFGYDKAFSKKFFVEGLNEPEIKAFLSRDVRYSFLKNHVKGYQYECFDNFILVSKYGSLDLKGRLKMLSSLLNITRDFRENSGELLR
ncbi:MAG: hypothetical protein II961_05430 [Candidatus Riflebacteria bacterium]|nr:hypothetical protein [Candidatus Riflebacteria bacterium]